MFSLKYIFQTNKQYSNRSLSASTSHHASVSCTRVYTAVAIHFSHTPKHTQLFSRLPCSGAVDIELKSSRGSGLQATLKIPTNNCSRDSRGLVVVVISPENPPAGRLRISESLLRIHVVGICLFPFFIKHRLHSPRPLRA